jgi:hypothetical protein
MALQKSKQTDNFNPVVLSECQAAVDTEWLTKFLDAIDRFFGDAGMADRTLFPRVFRLKTPAPLWTAPAFDRDV